MRLQISIIFFAASHAGSTPDQSFPLVIKAKSAIPTPSALRVKPKSSASLLPIINPSIPPLLGMR